MGSRMMHLIIAGHVAERMEISDRPRFLLGGVAPDAVHGREQKTKSHYYEGSVDDGTRRVNYEGFMQKYKEQMKDEFILGYVVHLVGDAVWMKDIYFKKDLKNRIDADPSVLEKWHADFRKLNSMLVNQFYCAGLEQQLASAELPETLIEEIEVNNLRKFTEETLGDFHSTKLSSSRDLEIYSVAEITGYIKSATEQAIRVCLSLGMQERQRSEHIGH
ncbi:zinc dependent phospholipase C family protein [Planococcus sp. CP5-4]|uniref:zinc dependent phospholipase C family protein n=1 Tax=unclassified Planococcus (in: firmicutes) TaxID=2662419 RepID=UPI001C23258C|nr:MULTISPECIES: zinc dependent phospholipase C family protein [unclassified Planococcus (in: firmicutes)]MBU9675067.1 zinc dependent phospholipase C family protein [Planococcus sp. CP5-4_YE]MBV0910156.1 zinc dependent phospholipase C family protein [Planococcus sp. CP5-4_UN]MBW6064637.1 zinc dependent phospholipase C family protein [Planococcus sp. CP5-4]